MGVQIRVARQKRTPKIQHRPFTEREKELNKMSRRDMIKQWKYKLDPYKCARACKGIRHPLAYYRRKLKTVRAEAVVEKV